MTTLNPAWDLTCKNLAILSTERDDADKVVFRREDGVHQFLRSTPASSETRLVLVDQEDGSLTVQQVRQLANSWYGDDLVVYRRPDGVHVKLKTAVGGHASRLVLLPQD